MCALILTSNEVYVIPVLKDVVWLRIKSTVETIVNVRRLKMVIFCKYYCKNKLNIRTIIFYGSVLISHIVMIDPTY